MRTSVGDDGTLGKIPMVKTQKKRKADLLENSSLEHPPRL